MVIGTFSKGPDLLLVLICRMLCRFVKHHSPYCGFCQKIKPTWQTLYEFYYVGFSVTSSYAEMLTFADFKSPEILDLEARVEPRIFPEFVPRLLQFSLWSDGLCCERGQMP